MTTNIQKFTGNFKDAANWKIAIVASQFNHFVVDQLEKGAIDTLLRHGVKQENMRIVHVPGAFELPLVTKKIASTGRVDGIIALGAVIRGATAHFDYVCSSATQGLARVSHECDLPVAFGVITTDTIEQAIERSGSKAGNKGAECATVVLEMISLLQQLETI